MWMKVEVLLPFSDEFVMCQINHNRVVKAHKDNIVPGIFLKFAAKNNSVPPHCPYCLSDCILSPRMKSRPLANTYPSLIIAIIINIKEDPLY